MVDVGFRPIIEAVSHFLCVKLQIFVCFRKVIDKFFAFFFGERLYGAKKPAMQNCKAGHIVSTQWNYYFPPPFQNSSSAFWRLM